MGQNQEQTELTTVHPAAEAAARRIAVFYLHGGALLFGERDDLPAPYVSMITGAGYELVCADYPLSPETALPQVVDSVFETWQTAVGARMASGELAGYYLFGRSAGGHLALMLAREIERRGAELPRPLGILDFYGYASLMLPEFSRPAKMFTKLATVERGQMERIVQKSGGAPTSIDPLSSRYLVYVYARQHEGAWLELMGLDGSAPERTPEAWSLTPGDIAALPPVFACASAADEEVPYGAGKRFARSCPKAVFKTVYDLPHDFDRDTSRPEGRQIYEAALAWMAKQED